MNAGFKNSTLPIKLLIVDDNAEMRNLIKMTFSTCGYEILEAAEGKQAIDLIMREMPEIVLLDVMMPGEVDGYGVCEFVKSSRLKYTWFIIMNAKGQQTDVDTGWQAGSDFYVTKPFSPLALIEMVDNIVVH